MSLGTALRPPYFDSNLRPRSIPPFSPHCVVRLSSLPLRASLGRQCLHCPPFQDHRPTSEWADFLPSIGHHTFALFPLTPWSLSSITRGKGGLAYGPSSPAFFSGRVLMADGGPFDLFHPTVLPTTTGPQWTVCSEDLWNRSPKVSVAVPPKTFHLATLHIWRAGDN